MISWKLPGNPEKYVKDILSREAADIPEEKINAFKWVLEEVLIDQIMVDETMIKNHDQDPAHIKRRDTFIEMLKTDQAIYPLIVLGRELYLVDGYARYRALKKLGVRSIEVVKQNF